MIKIGDVSIRNAGMFVRDARTAAGMTQAALAEKAGIAQPLLSAIETGKIHPEISVIQRIVESLDADAIAMATAIRPQARELTPLERRLLCRLLDVVTDDPGYAWFGKANLAIIRGVLSTEATAPAGDAA